MRELLAELTAGTRATAASASTVSSSRRAARRRRRPVPPCSFSPDGSQRGTLGGGCVEAEVKQRALRVLADRARPAGIPHLLPRRQLRLG